MKKLLAISLLALSSVSHAHSVTAEATTMTVKQGTWSAWAKHSAIIENNTDSSQEYTYTFTLCSKYLGCGKTISDTVRLLPHTNEKRTGTTILNRSWNQGYYQLEATTSISGESKDSIQGYGSISVY